MAGKTTTETSTSSKTSSQSRSESESRSESSSQSSSQSVSQRFLDDKLLEEILAGLTGYMSGEEMETYAENLLRPQLNAALEAAQQQYDTTELTKRQEIEALAASLADAIDAQESAYRQSAADVETAALARGMGRSSYTLQTLAQQGEALAKAVKALTEENEKSRSDLQAQITQAAQQSAATKARLNTDYAASLAAKVQELRAQQQKDYNQNYLAAVSGSMGQKTAGSTNTSTNTTGMSTTQTTGSSKTSGSVYSEAVSDSSGSTKKKTQSVYAPPEDQVDAISSAAMSVKRS